MVNNEILRFENGIRDESMPRGSTAKSAKNESQMDAASIADEKFAPSQSALSTFGNARLNTQIGNKENPLDQGSVYSNMEMVMKQLQLCQKEWAKLGYGGQSGRKFKFPNH